MRLPAVLLAAVLLTACAGAPSVEEPAGVTALGASVARAEPDATQADLRRLTAAQTAFAVDLYRAVRQGSAVPPDGDLVLGPGSLHTTLSMVRAGARGRTAQEMDAVLHATGLDGRLHELGNALDRVLASRSDADGLDLRTANRVWADDGLALREEYVRELATSYGAGLASVDIGADPEAARAAVNAWVAGATEGLVTELFPRGTLDGSTVLVLANALHLDAEWRFPFPAEATRVEPFRLPGGATVQVETMHYDEHLPSGRGQGWSAVKIPYAGEQLSMTVVVPEDLAAFEQRLDADLLAEVEASLADGGIHLALPRFTARSHLSLVEALSALGMPSAFGAADLSGMTAAGGLRLAAVEHEAVVEVDEQGTEAAAGSGGAVAGSHGPTVMVDRPFLFVVRDDATGAVLLLGRVTDPRG